MMNQSMLSPTVSSEAYFGENNSLVTEMLPHINLMKAICAKAIARNPTIKNSELRTKMLPEVDLLAKAIEQNLNIEKCNIGFVSNNDFYSVSYFCDTNLYSKKNNFRNYKQMKSNFDSIMETKDGYKFKSKDGIYIIIFMSIDAFKSDLLTDKEITALILHEIGHGLIGILDGLDSATIEYYTNVIVKNKNVVSGDVTADKLLEELKSATTDNEKSEKAMELIVGRSKGLQNETDGDMYDFSNVDLNNFDNVQLKTSNGNNVPKIDDPKNITYKPSLISRILYGIGNVFFTIFILPFLLPKIAKRRNDIQNIYNSEYKIKTEMFADEMAKAYGLSKDLQSALRKWRYDKLYTSKYVITKMPMFDFYNQYKLLREDYENAVSGYPSEMQRVVNSYTSCKYELEHNSDLTLEQKTELTKQIDALKSFYDDYVYDAKRNGALYRAFAKGCKDSIEEAASKDTNMRKNILEPLQERSNKYYKI